MVGPENSNSLLQLWFNDGKSRKELGVDVPQLKVMEQPVYYKASEPGREGPGLVSCYRVILP